MRRLMDLLFLYATNSANQTIPWVGLVNTTLVAWQLVFALVVLVQVKCTNVKYQAFLLSCSDF